MLMQAPQKILIIEDDEMILIPLRTILEKYKFDVHIEKDGLGGLQYAQNKPPNIILLDLMLPTMNGFQILEELKHDPHTRQISVVVVSNLGDAASIERALDLGAREYFVKSRTLLSHIVQYILREFPNPVEKKA